MTWYFEGDDIYFPTSEAERVLFKTKEGKVHPFVVLCDMKVRTDLGYIRE